MIDVEQELLNEIGNLRNELKQYKDIEDKLGIELAVLYEVFKNGFYAKENVGINHTEICRILPRDINQIDVIKKYVVTQYGFSYSTHSFKNYRKTWALTKEELL